MDEAVRLVSSCEHLAKTILDMEPITSAGFNDTLAGAEIFSLLKVDERILNDPREYGKLKEIADFVNMAPDAPSLLRSVLMKSRSPNINAIDHLASYVMLQKKRLSMRGELKRVEDEISLYE